MQIRARDADDQALQAQLVGICTDVLKSLIIAPDVQCQNISVTCLRSSRFDSSRERPIFVVTVHTNDASMVRGDSNPYKGSYKERIEAILDFHAKTMLPDCEVHLEIDGPSTGSVERLIPVEQLLRSGRLSNASPIAETARRFSIPDILIRGRHLIAPSPAIAVYLDSLVQNETIRTALDLFGGTGLTATVLCARGNPERVTVVERERTHLERMRKHLRDKRVEFVLGDAFNCELGRYDLIVADPYYEDALMFLDMRLETILRSARVFVFVPGKIEDVLWNNEIEEKLERTGSKVHRWASFGQVLFDVRT